MKKLLTLIALLPVTCLAADRIKVMNHTDVCAESLSKAQLFLVQATRHYIDARRNAFHSAIELGQVKTAMILISKQNLSPDETWKTLYLRIPGRYRIEGREIEWDEWAKREYWEEIGREIRKKDGAFQDSQEKDPYGRLFVRLLQIEWKIIRSLPQEASLIPYYQNLLIKFEELFRTSQPQYRQSQSSVRAGDLNQILVEVIPCYLKLKKVEFRSEVLTERDGKTKRRMFIIPPGPDSDFSRYAASLAARASNPPIVLAILPWIYMGQEGAVLDGSERITRLVGFTELIEFPDPKAMRLEPGHRGLKSLQDVSQGKRGLYVPSRIDLVTGAPKHSAMSLPLMWAGIRQVVANPPDSPDYAHLLALMAQNMSQHNAATLALSVETDATLLAVIGTLSRALAGTQELPRLRTVHQNCQLINFKNGVVFSLQHDAPPDIWLYPNQNEYISLPVTGGRMRAVFDSFWKQTVHMKENETFDRESTEKLYWIFDSLRSDNFTLTNLLKLGQRGIERAMNAAAHYLLNPSEENLQIFSDVTR